MASQHQTSRPKPGYLTIAQIDQEHDHTYRVERWTSRWTQPFSLAIFAVCFAGILAALEVIYRLSLRNNGLASVNVNEYYLWTYGPTAILTLLLAFWGRVDYRFRQMCPWQKFSQRSAAVNKVLFEDYLSPTLPEILWHSLRNKDLFVLASGLVSIIVTLLIIVSTGLLVSDLRTIPKLDVPYQTTYKLNAPAAEFTDYSSMWTDVIDGIDLYNLSYPPGTTPEFLYQTFQATTDPVGTVSRTAYVSVLGTNMSCSLAALDFSNVSLTWNSYSQSNCAIEAGMNSSATPVQTGRPSLNTSDWSAYPAINFPYGNDGDESYFAFMNTYDSSALDAAPAATPFYGFGIGRAVQKGSAGPRPATISCNQSLPVAKMQILESRQWLCGPRIFATMANVTYSSDSNNTNALPDIQLDSRVEVQYMPPDQTADFAIDWSSFLAADDQTIISQKIPSILTTLNTGSAYSCLLRALRVMPNATVDDLLHTDLLLNLSTTLYKRLLVQYMRLNYKTEVNSLANGTILTNENRLVVQPTPLRIMQALLATALILSIALAAFGGKVSTQYDSSRFAGLFLSLKDHRSLLTAFSQTSHLDYDSLYAKFVPNTKSAALFPNTSGDILLSNFTSSEHPSAFLQSIHPLPTKARAARPPRVKWWRPIAVTKASRLTIVFLIVLVLVTLLILLGVSQRHNGLADVVLGGNTHLVWSLVPATIMVTISMYTRAFDFTYKLISPYEQLRRGASAMTMFSNYVSATEVEVLWRASVDGELAIATISIGALACSLLTIVVSGVWSATAIASSENVGLGQKTWFSTGPSSDNGTINNNAFISGIILTMNASYPQWTYEDLAFPTFDVAKEPSKGNDTGAYLTTTLSAIRAHLNCTRYDQSQIPNVTYTNVANQPGEHGAPDPVVYGVSIPGTHECAITANITLSNPTTGLWATFVGNSQEGCPTLNYAWGRMNGTIADSNPGGEVAFFVTAMTCFESIEEVNVDVRLGADSLLFDLGQPPVVQANSNRTYSTADISVPYPSLPAYNFPEGGNVVVSGSIEEAGSGSLAFWPMLGYQSNIQLADFGSPDKVEAIETAIKKVHGTVRAQQYNAVLRQDQPPSNTQSPSQSPTARLNRPYRYRLVQNAVSTFVLCGLLLLIVICILLASWLMSTNYVLPKNPCSIAAQLSLVADSNIFDNAPVMERLDAALRDKKLRRQVLKGWRFRLGWTESSTSEGLNYTIDVLDLQDEDKMKGTGESVEARLTTDVH